MLATAFVIFPLACLKRLDSLRYASMFAIVAVLYFTSVVIVYGIIDLNLYRLGRPPSGIPLRDQIEYWRWSTDIFLGIPIIAFALGGHLQSVSIFRELPNKFRNTASWDKIIIWVVAFLSAVYISVGTLGYLRYCISNQSFHF